MSDVLLLWLDGAKPVIWKPEIDRCPPDCGGASADTIYYAPHCPTCDFTFGDLDHDKFCRMCGTKLWWKVEPPVILED